MTQEDFDLKIKELSMQYQFERERYPREWFERNIIPLIEESNGREFVVLEVKGENAIDPVFFWFALKYGITIERNPFEFCHVNQCFRHKVHIPFDWTGKRGVEP